MVKDKDPAFLFYSKDWLQGTAGLMPDEKGVYIDLLAHHHQDGDLPNDVKRLARMVGLSQLEFDVIWINLSTKFIQKDNRLVNRKLTKITTERSTKAHTKAIISRFAVLVKSARQYPVPVIEQIKLDFKVSDFELFEINESTERLTKWFSERLTTALEDANMYLGEVGSRVEEGVQGEEKGWRQMPGEAEIGLELPEMKAGAVLQLLVMTGNKGATMADVKNLWGVFKVQHFTGKKYYQSKNDVFSHFINCSKTQKINGTNRNGSYSRTAGGQDSTRIAKEGIGEL